MDNKENLIEELRNCAELLTQLANTTDTEKVASVEEHTIPVSSERHDYMLGVLEGMGLE